MAKKRLSRSKRNVARRARYANRPRERSKIQKQAAKRYAGYAAKRRAVQASNNIREGASERTNNNPLERASRAASKYERDHSDIEDVRDDIRVFFVPKSPKGARARWTVKSWKKFMREEKYRDAVSEILLTGDFVLGLQGEDGDMEDEIERLVEGI